MDLTKNAFHLLRVSSRTPLDELGKARDEAIDDGCATEEVLSCAQTALSTSMPRLDEEVSCLFEASPEDCELLIGQAVRGLGWEEIFVGMQFLSPLSRANLAAHVCATFGAGSGISENQVRDALHFLIETQEEISSRSVRDAINDSRREAGGIPMAREAHICIALDKLRQKHCRAARDAICKSEHPGKMMTAIAEKYRFSRTVCASFVIDLARDYDSWSIPILHRIEKNIDVAIDQLRAAPSDPFALKRIESLLTGWDEYSQPMQLLDEAKGLDEARSSVIFENLRSLSIELANKNELLVAHKLTIAMLRTFPELPQASEMLAEDIEQLETMIEKKESRDKIENELKSLTNILGEIMRNPLKHSNAIANGQGISLELEVVLNRLFAIPSMADEDFIWTGARGVAAHLYGTLRSSHRHFDLFYAARKLTKMLVSMSNRYMAPQKIRNALQKDLSALDARKQEIDDLLHQEKKQGRKGTIVWILCIVIIFIWILKPSPTSTRSLSDAGNSGQVTSQPDMIQVQPAERLVAQSSIPTEDQYDMHVKNIKGALNVRAAPNLDSAVIEQLTRFQDVVAIGVPMASGWQKISINDTIAYVSVDYLSAGTGASGERRACLASVARPLTGDILDQVASRGEHQLIVSNGSGFDVIVKLKSRSNRTIVSFYIRRGEIYTYTHVPEGHYKFTYATGRNYSRECDVFLDDFSIMQSADHDEYRTTKQDDYYYNTIWEYDLHLTPTGNFHPVKMNASEFLQD